jgi:amino acid adenylation domain-containing protein
MTHLSSTILPINGLLVARWEAQAATRSRAPALTLDSESLTYEEVNAWANRLAGYLRVRGIGVGSLVGIHMDRSFDMIVAILAILKTGGAYLPLDLACPDDRLNFILKDAGAHLVLTQAGHENRFKSYSGEIVCLDHEATHLAGFGFDNQSAKINPDDLAYVIYTSGSTGQPKGVRITHRNIARLFSTTEPLFHFGPRDIWTLFHSSAFDLSVWEIFGALVYGGRLVIVPYMVSRSAAAFRELLERERVTVLTQTPSAFRQLTRADEAAPKMKSELRYVIFAGEILDPQSLRSWFQRYGDERTRCINMYGITETTVHSTYYRVTLADLDRPASPIGHALPDSKIYLVDEKGAQVAPGETGEILVGGDGVAPGYLNRPELTQQRFIANPFEPEAFPHLYRSGDLARQRPGDAGLDYLGRRDYQVKIRGFRVELPEIEAVLTQHPGVREGAVLCRRDDDAEPRLVAYVVTRSAPAPSLEELRAHLARELPDYMVPATFVFLPEFPLTLNGKLDRKALPIPGTERPVLASAFLAPEGTLEEKLAGLWRTALRRDSVGAEDNFFDLGGDSLLLTSIHGQLQTELNREIPITDLFQFPTIRLLARHLEGSRNDATVNPAARAFLQRAAFSRGRRPAPSSST